MFRHTESQVIVFLVEEILQGLFSENYRKDEAGYRKFRNDGVGRGSGIAVKKPAAGNSDRRTRPAQRDGRKPVWVSLDCAQDKRVPPSAPFFLGFPVAGLVCTLGAWGEVLRWQSFSPARPGNCTSKASRARN